VKREKITSSFHLQDIVSFDQLSPTSLMNLFAKVPRMKSITQNSTPSKILSGKVVTLLFYEPSSRTFASFAAAVKRLGGQTLEIIDPTNFSSVSKGESFEDTINTFEAYSDMIILRHPQKGASENASLQAMVPIINAGDGIGEHPTQALLDLYTIYEQYGRLENLTGVLTGDILNGRTIHSLIRGLSLFKNNTLYLLSPRELKLSDADRKEFIKRNISIIEIHKESDIPQNADFWYWTRVQKERFITNQEYEKVKNKFILSRDLVDKYAGKDTIFMHPLPRVGEIMPEVDLDPRAYYLRNQIRNGMYVRMALLALVLGGIK